MLKAAFAALSLEAQQLRAGGAAHLGDCSCGVHEALEPIPSMA